MPYNKKTILLIGTFLSEIENIYSVIESFAIHLENNGWKVLTASHKPNRISRMLDIVITILKHRNRYQIAQIDVYSGPAFIWAFTAGWLLNLMNKPFILTLHGGNLPQFSECWPKFVRYLLQSAIVVTAPSRYLVKEIRTFRHDIQFIPNPINLSKYKFHLRKSSAPRLVWLRAFHYIYNPTMAPRVLAFLLPTFPSAHLVMVGPDKGDGSLQATKKLAQELGVLEKIHFPGAVPNTEVPAWLNSGDVFINTTNKDNTPVSVIEAMACGLCVISTDVGGIPYLLMNENNALLVPANNAKAMAAAIERILSSPDLTQKISMQARITAIHFDWEKVWPQWENLLTKIAGPLIKTE